MLTIYYSQITTLLKKTLSRIKKLNKREFYSIFEYTHSYKPTPQKYFNELFKTGRFDLK